MRRLDAIVFTGPGPLPILISKEPKVMAGMILLWRESSSHFGSKDVLPHTLQRLRHRRLARALLATIITAIVLLAGPDAQAEEVPILEKRVSKVLDGDTFTLRGESRRIRVWGVNGGAKLCHGAAQNWASFGSGVTGRRQRRPVIRAPHVAGG